MKKLFLLFFSGVLFATEYQFQKTPCTRMAHMLAAADAVAAMPLLKQGLIDPKGQDKKSVYMVADTMRHSYEKLCSGEEAAGAIVYNLDRYAMAKMRPADVKSEYKKSESFYRKARAEDSLATIRNTDPIVIAITPAKERHAHALANAVARIEKERLGVAHENVPCQAGSECFLERAYYHMLSEEMKTLSDTQLREKLAELVAKR